MEQRRAHAVALLLGASLLVGCATFTPQGTVRDPWMPVNRPVHTFNDKADQWVLGPVARGWKKITPSFVRTGIANAFYNLRCAWSRASGRATRTRWPARPPAS